MSSRPVSRDIIAEKECVMFERLERFAICPDCEEDEFIEGPHGGFSINFKCANKLCGSEFNDLGPFGIERISVPQPNGTL